MAEDGTTERMKRASRPSARSKLIYSLEMTLRESDPRIWRQLLVPGATTLHQLHQVLQATMLWEDYHLYEFTAGGKRYGVYEDEYPAEQPLLNARRTSLRDVAPEVGATFTYVYDFGDHWQHDLIVLAIERPDRRRQYPLCIAGERAGPPEDSGGIWGYHESLAQLRKGKGAEYDELLTWLGGDFDPAGFDRNLVNRRLRHLR